MIDAQDVLISSLTNQNKQSAFAATQARREANTSARRAKTVSETLDHTKKLLQASLAREELLKKSVDKLQRDIDQSSDNFDSLALEIPDGGITKSRKGRGGAVSWPNFVWEEILGQLVIGVPPKAVYRSIARIVRRVAPKK